MVVVPFCSVILITCEALVAAGVMTPAGIDHVDTLIRAVARVISEAFTARGMHVIDGKFELGRLSTGKGEYVNGKRTIRGNHQLEAAELEMAFLA